MNFHLKCLHCSYNFYYCQQVNSRRRQRVTYYDMGLYFRIYHLVLSSCKQVQGSSPIVNQTLNLRGDTFTELPILLKQHEQSMFVHCELKLWIKHISVINSANLDYIRVENISLVKRGCNRAVEHFDIHYGHCSWIKSLLTDAQVSHFCNRPQSRLSQLPRIPNVGSNCTMHTFSF